jgi:hypothetical protein
MHRQKTSHPIIDPPTTASMEDMTSCVTMIRRHGIKTLMRIQTTFKIILSELIMHKTPARAMKQKEVNHARTTLQSTMTATCRPVSIAKHNNHSIQAAQTMPPFRMILPRIAFVPARPSAQATSHPLLMVITHVNNHTLPDATPPRRLDSMIASTTTLRLDDRPCPPWHIMTPRHLHMAILAMYGIENHPSPF